MSNPRKAEGTDWEQAIIHDALAKGLQAWPLARRGPSDPGDLVVVDKNGDHWVVEARQRQQMGVHRELAKAKEQTARADLPFVPYSTVIAWKRLEKKGGNERRTAVGRPVVVIDLEDWLDSLT